MCSAGMDLDIVESLSFPWTFMRYRDVVMEDPTWTQSNRGLYSTENGEWRYYPYPDYLHAFCFLQNGMMCPKSDLHRSDAGAMRKVHCGLFTGLAHRVPASVSDHRKSMIKLQIYTECFKPCVVWRPQLNISGLWMKLWIFFNGNTMVCLFCYVGPYSVGLFHRLSQNIICIPDISFETKSRSQFCKVIPVHGVIRSPT